jgi:hypothetical protein
MPMAITYFIPPYTRRWRLPASVPLRNHLGTRKYRFGTTKYHFGTTKYHFGTTQEPESTAFHQSNQTTKYHNRL